jgi:hypothetical protein
MAEQREIDN